MSRWQLVGLFAGWGAFCAFCVDGFPPSVDLPAHGAQMQTLAELVRGNAEVSAYYRPAFPIGYGLPHWLFLPLTLLSNGATAVRVAAWTTLALFPLSHWALLRAFGRSSWALPLGLPFAFNISYWYGFLPSLLAVPLALLALAAFARAQRAPHPLRWVAAFSLLATLTLLSHLIPFAALGVGVATLVLASTHRRRALGWAVAGLALPAALAASRVFTLVWRAVQPQAHLPTQYGWGSHLNWLFRNVRVEGYLAVAGPLLIAAAMVAAYLWWRKREPATPALLFLALFVLFLATPRDLSGAWLVHVRLLAMVGLCATLMVEVTRLPLAVRLGLMGVAALSLAETALFHQRFKQSVEGLEELVNRPPPSGPHGYLPSQGTRALGSRLPYLEHLGNWWTATQGGVGHHFFADIDHQPVREVKGMSLPQDLSRAGPQALDPFRAVLVLGEEAPAPGWSAKGKSGPWQLWVRTAPARE